MFLDIVPIEAVEPLNKIKHILYNYLCVIRDDILESGGVEARNWKIPLDNLRFLVHPSFNVSELVWIPEGHEISVKYLQMVYQHILETMKAMEYLAHFVESPYILELLYKQAEQGGTPIRLKPYELDWLEDTIKNYPVECEKLFKTVTLLKLCN